MDKSAKLQTQLQTILYGQPWYGTPIYTILEAVSFEAAYQKPQGALHNIYQILTHMLAWTEEATERMQQKPAAQPLRGDWSTSGTPDEQKWLQLIASFKLANVELTQQITAFTDEQWTEDTNDSRETYTGYGATYEALITGLMQHHVYHAGQISILNTIING
ncbi:putative damage-inducible protein DinB [Mucilaginibacter gracilis]|uniref:Putative damage-inducible protein DinB n=1 Tax=Mucilaginibacter gracilis TaxID=423350 RepID=A0A495J8U8_9SPHI|nr:DinB family protein [Mucilaginibacter gracilis]RKR85317.1 putative damage-inducible protein DinB [Mucilaginibacter gracilis]